MSQASSLSLTLHLEILKHSLTYACAVRNKPRTKHRLYMQIESMAFRQLHKGLTDYRGKDVALI